MKRKASPVTLDSLALRCSPAVIAANPHLFAHAETPVAQAASPVPAPAAARRTRAARVSRPVAQPDARSTLDAPSPRKGKGVPCAVCRPRLAVVFRLYRVRLLDFDNAGGSVKFLCDALRAEGVIPDDDPGSIVGTVEQVNVRRKVEERTEVIVSALAQGGS